MKGYQILTYPDLAIAYLFIVFFMAISLFFKLKLEKRFLVGSLRATAQLLLLGFILEEVFALNTWYLVIGYILIMTLVAGFTATKRIDFYYKGIFIDSFAVLWSCSWIAIFTAVVIVIKAKPWYSPQYMIPLMGMILGNMLNGVSLGLDRFCSELLSNRLKVEMILTLGGTRWEAAHIYVKKSIRAGTTPVINMMMIAGVVSLPGMMTGQIIGGISPINAVKYQLMILFIISASTAIGTLLATIITFLRFFNSSHQFHFNAVKEK